MKTSRQEHEFFSYFNDVEIVDVPQDPLDRFRSDVSRYYVRMCKCGAVIQGDRVTCPDCDKKLEG